jgi:hypothetical protein
MRARSGKSPQSSFHCLVSLSQKAFVLIAKVFMNFSCFHPIIAHVELGKSHKLQQGNESVKKLLTKFLVSRFASQKSLSTAGPEEF